MVVLSCRVCQKQRAIIKRPKNGYGVCKQCFFDCFEQEVHETITRGHLFKSGQRVAIASSGGKDSTVLGHVLTLLNKKHDYGLDLHLLSIDEGISGYRDDSLQAVRRNQVELELPLTILDYRQLYGWTMDDIVRTVGLKSNCTFCGVFRRQALDRGAVQLNCDIIVTGHNADDLAETILMNVLRGDVARLKRTVHITTGHQDEQTKPSSIKRSEAASQNSNSKTMNVEPSSMTSSCETNCEDCGCDKSKKLLQQLLNQDHPAEHQKQQLTTKKLGHIPRSKPLKYTYEKEIVLYAYFKKLDYFSTECVYAPNSYRGHARAFLKDLESIRPSAIIDIIHSGECMQVKADLPLPSQGYCVRCGYLSSQSICKACVMLEGLNKGQPRLGVGKSKKVELIRKIQQDISGDRANSDLSMHKNSGQRFCRKLNCDCGLVHKPSQRQLRKEQEFTQRLSSN